MQHSLTFSLQPSDLRHEPYEQTYLAGESYAGQYIPYIGTTYFDRLIASDRRDNPNVFEANGILNTVKLPTRLKGVAIGNGWIDPISQYPAYVEFAVKEKLLTKGSTEYNQVVEALETCQKALNTTDLTPHVGACELLMGKTVDHLQSTLVFHLC